MLRTSSRSIGTPYNDASSNPSGPAACVIAPPGGGARSILGSPDSQEKIADRLGLEPSVLVPRTALAAVTASAQRVVEDCARSGRYEIEGKIRGRLADVRDRLDDTHIPHKCKRKARHLSARLVRTAALEGWRQLTCARVATIVYLTLKLRKGEPVPTPTESRIELGFSLGILLADKASDEYLEDVTLVHAAVVHSRVSDPASRARYIEAWEQAIESAVNHHISPAHDSEPLKTVLKKKLIPSESGF